MTGAVGANSTKIMNVKIMVNVKNNGQRKYLGILFTKLYVDSF